MKAADLAVRQRKLRRAQALHETASEMQAVADGLFAEVRRLVDQLQGVKSDRPMSLVRPQRH